MVENHYNIETVVKISVFPKQEANQWSWMPEKKILFGLFTWRREGVYDVYGSEFYLTEEKLDKYNMYLEHGVVYHKPHINLKFVNNDIGTTLFFETVPEMNKHVVTIKGMAGTWQKNIEKKESFFEVNHPV